MITTKEIEEFLDLLAKAHEDVSWLRSQSAHKRLDEIEQWVLAKLGGADGQL